MGASQVVLVVKNPPTNEGDAGDTSLIPGSGRSHRVGNGNPLQYSCLGYPMDREACWAIVRAITKESDTTEHVRTFCFKEPEMYSSGRLFLWALLRFIPISTASDLGKRESDSEHLPSQRGKSKQYAHSGPLTIPFGITFWVYKTPIFPFQVAPEHV